MKHCNAARKKHYYNPNSLEFISSPWLPVCQILLDQKVECLTREHIAVWMNDWQTRRFIYYCHLFLNKSTRYKGQHNLNTYFLVILLQLAQLYVHYWFCMCALHNESQNWAIYNQYNIIMYHFLYGFNVNRKCELWLIFCHMFVKSEQASRFIAPISSYFILAGNVFLQIKYMAMYKFSTCRSCNVF